MSVCLFLEELGAARRVGFLSSRMLVSQGLLQGRREGVVTFPGTHVSSGEPGLPASWEVLALRCNQFTLKGPRSVQRKPAPTPSCHCDRQMKAPSHTAKIPA
jgi:hypothetical protein